MHLNTTENIAAHPTDATAAVRNVITGDAAPLQVRSAIPNSLSGADAAWAGFSAPATSAICCSI